MSFNTNTLIEEILAAIVGARVDRVLDAAHRWAAELLVRACRSALALWQLFRGALAATGSVAAAVSIAGLFAGKQSDQKTCVAVLLMLALLWFAGGRPNSPIEATAGWRGMSAV